MKYIFYALTLIIFSSFIPELPAGDKQGIQGYVQQIVGNRMPSPDEPLPEPKGVKTTVYIYQKTNIDEVERIGTESFYKSIRTKLIRTVNTTKAGYFFASLPIGEYSLFTKVDGRFYANNFDENNNIALIEVRKNKVSKLNIKIDANATQ